MLAWQHRWFKIAVYDRAYEDALYRWWRKRSVALPIQQVLLDAESQGMPGEAGFLWLVSHDAKTL